MYHIPTSKNYFKNLEQLGPRSGNAEGNLPCVVCGKGIPTATAKHWVRVFWGTVVVMPDEARAIIDHESDAGDLGFNAVGSDCLRKHPELRPYVNAGAKR